MILLTLASAHVFPEYIETSYNRIGEFRTGFDEFKRLLQMRQGEFGSGQVLVQCNDSSAKSDCTYEILNYRHLYWCEGRGCPPAQTVMRR
jgi:hypothetical protein